MGLLSWLSNRRQGAESSADVATAPTETSSAAAPTVPAWRELPPLQRALDAPGLISDPVGFRGSLSAWQDTSFHRPLGHLVSPEAPSGLGHGLTSAFTVSRETDEPSRTSEVGPGRTIGTPAPARLQRASEEASLVSARPLETSLQDLPQLAVAAPPSHVTTSTDTSSADTSTKQVAPVQRSVQPEASVEPGTSSPPSAAFRPRGLGLGEPLHRLPLTAQRSAGPHTSPPAAQLDPPASEGASESGPTEHADLPSRPLLGDDPLPTVARTGETSQEAAASPGQVDHAAPAHPPVVRGPVPLQRAAEDGTPLPRLPKPAPEPTVPLTAQRSVPLFSGAEAPSDDAPAGETPAPVPVQWTAPGLPETGPPAAASATTDSRPAGTSFPAAAAPVQRTVAQPQAVSPAPSPRVTPTPQLQRTAASPPLSTPVQRATVRTTPVDAGSVAVAAGVAQRMADGSVVFQAPTVQRDAGSDPRPTDTSAEDAPAEPVDPPPEPDPEPDPDPGPDPTDQPSPSDAHDPQGAHPPKGGTPKVTDELVRALFAPLSRMLKAELRLDRERAGFLIDTRH